MARLALGLTLLVAWWGLLDLPAHAAGSVQLDARRAESAESYERMLREISLSDARAAEIAAEIARLRKDHASVTAALIQAAKTEKKLADDISDIEFRLGELTARQGDVRNSLSARREVLAQVLGALQRMGINPPPALLVRPDDALGSVRSAILLGAVVPELREETTALLADLEQLQMLATSIAAERARLVAAATEQAAGRRRLALLQEEKTKLVDRSESDLAMEQARAAELAARAGSLQELIEGLDAEIAAVRAEDERRRREEAERLSRPVPEQHRLTGPAQFASLAGRLAFPASGRPVSRFGESDGFGGSRMGDTLQTQSNSIVTSPVDGTILYAGPFRSYGQLLILDAGDGYHVVLSGMERIGAIPGQSVLTGEPVGSMGATRVASADASAAESVGPRLYIEFRKDGKPIDPSPWWAERKSGRTGNDS